MKVRVSFLCEVCSAAHCAMTVVSRVMVNPSRDISHPAVERFLVENPTPTCVCFK